MALIRLSKAARRLQTSALFLQLIRPVLSPPNPNPKTPSHSSQQPFTRNLFNSLNTHTLYLPNYVYIQQNHNLRDFNPTQLVKNAGISTSGYEKKEGSKVKGCSRIDLNLPKKVVGFAHLARLDKPIGTWLLAWPCMWMYSVKVYYGGHIVHVPSFSYTASQYGVMKQIFLIAFNSFSFFDTMFMSSLFFIFEADNSFFNYAISLSARFSSSLKLKSSSAFTFAFIFKSSITSLALFVKWRFSPFKEVATY